MKKLIGISSLVSGLLLIVVPRFVLPACEFLGYTRMHCSDTANAALIGGGVFILLGIAALVLKPSSAIIGIEAAALALSIIVFVLPDRIGYCQSSRMPCNYGMVPGIRFIASITGIIMAVCVARSVQGLKRKGSA